MSKHRVITCPNLTKLTDAEKDALILALFVQLGTSHEKIAALQAQLDELTKPPKTPENSSKPPRKAKSRTARPRTAIAHHAKAARASGGRCIRTRTE